MKSNDKDTFITMVGFAKRAGEIVYGYDGLRKARGVKLLAVSDGASDNLKSDMARLAEKNGLPLVTAPSLESKIGNNVKALGLTDENMSKAVVDFISKGAANYSIK